MSPRPARERRRGIMMAEAAIVYPVAISLIMLTIVAGLGMYRYQEVVFLAREGSRWASVHGPKYQTDQGASAPIASDVLTNAVIPKASGLQTGKLSSTLTWNTAATPPTVTYTLNFNWVPEAILGSKTFTSTSTQVITY